MRKAEWTEGLLVAGQGERRGYGVGRAESGSWEIRLRVRMVWAIVILLLAVSSARAAYLQLWESGQQGLLAETNHIELTPKTAERGIVYDQGGVALTANVWDETARRYQRVYPYGASMAPVLGYLAEVRADELGCQAGICYTPGTYIGRVGIEAQFENRLKGRDGGILEERDAGGGVVRELGKNEPEKGDDLTLTLDHRLQTKMYQAMEGKRGAAVALDLQGRVWGLVSVPTYDPERVPEFLADSREFYFLNRAISGNYAPGSVFKLVTAYAGLMEGTLDGETRIVDTGEIRVGPYRYGNWYFDQYGRTEGELDLPRAIARSNDVFFYRVGEAVGVDKLVSWARRFGLGERTGIELSGEVAGLVPDRLQKERATGESWFLGNTYHLAIGQGDLLVTPLQVARETAAAVSGRLCRVSIVKGTSIDCRDLGIPTDRTMLVREGMRQACASGGTAYPFFTFEPYVLCKTGTAQHAGQLTEEDLPHAWVTVAYPGENPELILTVFVEAGGEGSAVAAPVAREILDYWKGLGN